MENFGQDDKLVLGWWSREGDQGRRQRIKPLISHCDFICYLAPLPLPPSLFASRCSFNLEVHLTDASTSASTGPTNAISPRQRPIPLNIHPDPTSRALDCSPTHLFTRSIEDHIWIRPGGSSEAIRPVRVGQGDDETSEEIRE